MPTVKQNAPFVTGKRSRHEPGESSCYQCVGYLISRFSSKNNSILQTFSSPFHSVSLSSRYSRCLPYSGLIRFGVGPYNFNPGPSTAIVYIVHRSYVTRSTTDNVVFLENMIQKSINNKQHTIVVFLDIAQAYDEVNIEGLLFKLGTKGIKGKIIKFLYNYLIDRTYQVRVNGRLSETKSLSKGLPQGSTLSPLLFNIMMSDIPTNPQVGILAYADDIVIYTSGKNTKLIGKKIQKYLDELNTWFEKWDLRLSLAKSIPVLFTKSTKPHYPTITLSDTPLTYSMTHKFLGITFDSKLQWHAHIDNLTKRCKRKINLLRCLSGTKWGSTTKSLLMVYRAYIRSLLDYGCEAYDSASESVKKSLDSIQYQSLRICTGTLPLTSLAALQTETGEMPLDLRRSMLSNNFKISVIRIPSHPLTNHIKPCWQFEYINDKRCNKPFGYRTIETNVTEIEPYSPKPLSPMDTNNPQNFY